MQSPRECEQVKELSSLHQELWDRLQEQDEQTAAYNLRKYLRALDKQQRVRECLDWLAEYCREHWLLLSILTGLVSGPLLVCLFIWIALWVE